MTAATLMQGESTTWSELRTNRREHTFTWPDLDGLHWTANLPDEAPHTSLLHGWSADGKTLVRARLDGDQVWEAVLRLGGNESVTLIEPEPWGANEKRVGQFHSPDDLATDVVPAQVEVPDLGNGALVFLVPKELAGAWR